MSVILITTLFYKALILQGEIWCSSLLGLKGLKRSNVYLIQTREALRVPTAYSFLLKSILGEFKLSNSRKANESLLGPFL